MWKKLSTYLFLVGALAILIFGLCAGGALAKNYYIEQLNQYARDYSAKDIAYKSAIERCRNLEVLGDDLERRFRDYDLRTRESYSQLIRATGNLSNGLRDDAEGLQGVVAGIDQIKKLIIALPTP